jgi:hypothetical protein
VSTWGVFVSSLQTTAMKRNSITDGATGSTKYVMGVDPAKPGNEPGAFLMIDINALKARNFSVEEFLRIYESTGFQMLTPVEPDIQLLDNAKAETYDAVTEVIRRADARHKLTGGGSRHYVRDILLPLLEEAGIRLCRVNQKQNESPKQETLY